MGDIHQCFHVFRWVDLTPLAVCCFGKVLSEQIQETMNRNLSFTIIVIEFILVYGFIGQITFVKYTD